jgi:hypothetical protein
MNKTADQRYIELMRDISAKLQTLTIAQNMRYNTSPDDIDWGHVGDLSRINDLLAEVVELSK